MPLAGFETVMPAIGWPQTHALDRAATGLGLVYLLAITMLVEENKLCSSSLCAFLIHSEVTFSFLLWCLHIFLSILLSCRLLEERMSRISSAYWTQSEMKETFIYSISHRTCSLFTLKQTPVTSKLPGDTTASFYNQELVYGHYSH